MGRTSIRLLVLMIVLCLTAPSLAAVQLVVNPSVPASTLTPSTVRALFNMRLLQWPDGTPVRVFVLKDKDPLHKAFSKNFLQVFPYQLRRSWDRRIFSGIGQAPQQVNDIHEMHTRVADTPGAIGYLPEDRIDESVKKIDTD